MLGKCSLGKYKQEQINPTNFPPLMSSDLAIINNTEIVINIYINIIREGLWTSW